MPEMIPQWLSDWAHTVTLFDFALWAAGGVGLVVFVRKGWPAVKNFATALFNFVQIVDSVAGLPAFIARTDTTLHEQTETLEAQDVKIAEIHHEVNYNNGSSVKDAIDRVERGVKGLYDRVDELTASDEQMRRDIEDTRPNPPKE